MKQREPGHPGSLCFWRQTDRSIRSLYCFCQPDELQSLPEQ